MKNIFKFYEDKQGFSYVCEVPKELGAVTDLTEKQGKIIADTESGIKFIVPVFKESET